MKTQPLRKLTTEGLARIVAWEASDPVTRGNGTVLARELDISDALFSYHAKKARQRRTAPPA